MWAFVQGDLDDLYDAPTLGRLDRAAHTVPARTQRRGRGGIGATAVAAGIAFGMREILDPPEETPIIEEIDMAGLVRDDQPVTFHYVHEVPAASRAIVRPWLLSA